MIFDRLIRVLQHLGGETTQPANSPEVAAPQSPDTVILEQYVDTPPSVQNALDIFAGGWTSKLPEPYADLRSGHLLLFEDTRLEWGLAELGGVTNQRVLELGPLECGHSHLLLRHGAASVLAIEANTHAYLKCLIVKDIFGMSNLTLQCGDFVSFLRQTEEQWDLCVASGVLYHMTNPAELIALIAKVSKRVYMWTHYYDGAILAQNPDLAPKFGEQVPSVYADFEHTLYRQNYLAALERKDFCGGSRPHSMWLSRADLLRCLDHFGFTKVTIAFEEPYHMHGPALSLVAAQA